MPVIDYKQVLNEVYFGKSKELLKAERILGEFRSKYYGSGKFISAAEADPLKREFEKILEDFFNFKHYNFGITSAMITNSFTYPVGYTLNGMQSKIVSSPSGFKYAEKTNCMIQVIYSYMLFDPAYTDGEIMAITLHEIGHNFSHKRSNSVFIRDCYMSLLCMVYIVIYLLNQQFQGAADLFLNTTSIGRELKVSTLSKLTESDVIALLKSIIDQLANIKQVLIYNINAVINPLIVLSNPGLVLVGQFLCMLCNLPNVLIGYVDERIADQFATIYGYGPELQSGLRKMNTKGSVTTQKIIHKIPVVGWIYDLINIPTHWMLNLFDPHPTLESRRRAQYLYLMEEMEKAGISAEERREVQKEIDRMERYMSEIERQVKPLSGSVIAEKYTDIMSQIGKGTDPREYFFDYRDDVRKWDRMYNDGRRRK